MSKINLQCDYPQLAEKMLLNIDDNEMNQLLLAKILNNVGIKTVPAHNGEEAVKMLKDGLKPDFILLDMEMPVMDGMEAAEQIRQRFDPGIPIIINSGYVTALQKWKLTKLKIRDFLEKPYNIKDILSKLVKNLSLSKT